jgi:HEAT repeat protein
MITYFCPFCWNEIKETDKVCPYCHSELSGYYNKNFEEKLINALNHPERETARRAAYILGRLKSANAVKKLVELFGLTTDPYIKMEILEALYNIGTDEADAFVRKAAGSDVAVIRRKARELLEREKRG